VRKPLAPHFCVAESFVAGMPSPEQVLAAARLPGLCAVIIARTAAKPPWLCSRGPQLTPGPGCVENHGRTLHPGQLRRGAAARR
jgi:hypothetical protein